MRLISALFSLLSLLVRAALVAAPLALEFIKPFGFEIRPFLDQHIGGLYIHILFPMFVSPVLFFILFFRELCNLQPNPYAQDEDTSSNNFAHMTPGTPEWNIHNYGGQLDLVNGPHGSNSD